MPCYHPIPAQITPERGGKKRVQIVKAEAAGHWLPCLKCLGCREMKQQELALRLTHEAKSYNNKLFLTLTFDEKSKPSGLDKRELQGFWKRLRITAQRQILAHTKRNMANPSIHIEERGLKYLACGEYGDKRQREHYHGGVLGLKIDDQKKWDSENNTSETINKIWGNGIVTISELTEDRINYVAGYVLKKAGYKKQWYTTEPTYEDWGEWREILQEPYRDMSKGLGKDWLIKYATDLRNGYVQEKGAKYSIPRYYMDYIKEHKPELEKYIENKKAENWKELTADDRKLLHNQEKIRQMQIRQYRASRAL